MPPPVTPQPTPTGDRPISSPLTLPPPPAVTAAGYIAALHDRVAALLESLLRKNAVPITPLKPPALSPQLTGPDAEYLRLQYEALALAVEALNLRAGGAGAPGGAKPKSPTPQK